MNGTSIIATGVLGNPGAAWQVKNDGPIPPDQMTTASADASLLSRNGASPFFGAPAFHAS